MGDTGVRKSFDLDWERDYFFIDTSNGPECLICEKVISQYKKFNVKRHYQTHSNELANLVSPIDRANKLQELKMKRQLNQDGEVITHFDVFVFQS